ncbi:MAG: pyridoxal-dependent decarboxylase [Gammaproteobacteria bacterium]|nr:MAG: pyridoxal-dependent decarboxylase [Gammaproteobacteria bacterium]
MGNYDKNDDLFETLLVGLMEDHIAWRQINYPQNTPAPQKEKSLNIEFAQAVDHMKRHISQLISELKVSSSTNLPGYFGHMGSDLLLPGLIAQLLTTLYNPNNVTGNVKPITVDMELQAGRQIARMLGYNTDPAIHPCAWGHITSTGNSANYDSLWNARAISCYPLALKAAAKKLHIDLKISPYSNKKIAESSSWQCQNFSVDEVLDLHEFCYQQLLASSNLQTVKNFFKQVEQHRIEHMGMASFYAEHWDAKQPLVLVPSTCASSWKKYLKLLGFGSSQLLTLDVNNKMRIDINSLERILTNAEQKKIPILSVVGILGTTEFGSIDPLADIVLLRDRFRAKGLNFYFHIDASWGGYLSSLFRNPDNSLCSYDEMKKQFKNFPAKHTYDAFATINKADSVTVDPHKMGYLPIGTGAFISRNRAITNLCNDNAITNLNHVKNIEQDNRQLKEYLLEGTKPGAVAVACCLTQRILPLNNQHFGKILSESIHATEYFHERIKKTIKKLKGFVNIVLPMKPDSNIICLAINPVNNHCLTRMNRFSQRVYKQLTNDPEQANPHSAFFCSVTSLLHSNLGNEDAQSLLKKLNIRDSSFVINIEDPKVQSSSIDVLQHTLLNPWLLTEIDGNNFIDGYCEYLEDCIITVVNKESSHTLIAVGAR